MDVTGVSGHAILPNIITPPITQAYCVHYSCPQRSSSGAVTAGAVTELSITGTHAVCSSDPTVTREPPVRLSSAVESGSELGVNDRHLVYKLIQTESNLEATFTGTAVFETEAWGSKTPATQITTRTTHISSCLSTSVHSWVTGSQGILLTCLFNFTETHNSCCHHTYQRRTSQMCRSLWAKMCISFPLLLRCVLSSFIAMREFWWLIFLLAKWKVACEAIYLIFPQLIDRFTCDLSRLSCSPHPALNQSLEGVERSCHCRNVVLFMTLPLW